jgi:hypothetical protein
MLEDDIQELLAHGWWVSVSPVMSNGKWSFTCGIYKRFASSGNWTTETCKTFRKPQQCYNWAHNYLERNIQWKKKQKN